MKSSMYVIIIIDVNIKFVNIFITAYNIINIIVNFVLTFYNILALL